MTHKSFFISLLCASALLISSCGGNSSGGSKSSGTIHSTGLFSVQIPEGWEVSPFYHMGTEDVDLKTVAVHKGTALEFQVMLCPTLQIQYYPEGKHYVAQSKSNYQQAEDMEPLTLGKNTWNGFSCMTSKYGGEYNIPLYWFMTDMDGNKFAIAYWPELGEEKTSLNDADVKAIISSITLD